LEACGGEATDLPGRLTPDAIAVWDADMGDLRAIVGRSPGVAVASVLRLSGSITFFGERTKDSLARYDARRASVVDLDHLARIRQNPAGFAPGGVRHLILEVLAHAADEAERNEGDEARVASAACVHLPDGVPADQVIRSARSAWLRRQSICSWQSGRYR